MSRSFISSLLVSIILVAVIAVGIAWALSAWLAFWATFGAAFALIFAGSFMYNASRERQIEADQLEIYAKADLLDHRNTVVIECPCKQNSFKMQVLPNEINSYTCDVCYNKFNLDLRIEPVLQTEPVNLDNAYEIFKSLQDRSDDAADAIEAREILSKLTSAEPVYNDVGETNNNATGNNRTESQG